MDLFFRYLNLVCKMLSTENMVSDKNTLARKTSLKSIETITYILKKQSSVIQRCQVHAMCEI